MKKYHLFLFVSTLFFFQYSILGIFFQNGRIPNLFVALAVSLAVIFGLEKSLVWIIFSGFLMDIGSFWLIGTGIMALLIILWLIDKVKAIAEFRSKRYLFVFLLFLTAGLSSIAFDILIRIILKAERIFLSDINFSECYPLFGTDNVLKAVYTSLSALAVYFFARKMLKKTNVFLAKKRK